MILHLKIIGSLFIILALIHPFFPKYFKWKQELQSLSLINRQMMQVHTFFIALTVLLMGLLCLFCADDLVNTCFGKKISIGLFAFWCIRFIFQLFIYSPKLWQGKNFETIIHILFSILWLYLSIVFGIIAFKK